jgi:hypothetical protein
MRLRWPTIRKAARLETLVMTERSTEGAESTGGKTPYGWYLDELMARYRVPSQKVLADIVSDAGHPITQSQVSKIMRGKPKADADFGSALAEGLGLTNADRHEHANLLTYGQNRVLSPANMGRMEDYKRRAKEIEDRGTPFGEEIPEGDIVDRQDRGV